MMKAKTSYFDLLKLSWNKLWKNPVLFLPIVFMALSVAVFGLIAIFSFLPSLVLMRDPMEILGIIRNMLAIIIFLVLALLFVLQVFNTMLQGMVKDVAVKGKTSLKEGMNYVKKFYFRLLGLEIIKFFIIAVLIGLFVLLFLGLGFSKIGLIGSIFLILLLIVLFFLYALYFFFANQSMFLDNNSILGSIKSSFSLFNKKPLFVIKVFSVTVLVGIIGALIGVIFSFIPILGAIVDTFLRFVIGLIIAVFIFSVYVNKNKLN